MTPKPSPTPPSPFHNDFPPVAYAAWLQQVESELVGAPFGRLVGRTADGVTTEPLYVAADLPGAVPFGRRGVRGWQRAQEYRGREIETVRAEIAADLALGVERLWLHLGDDGVAVAMAAELDRLLGDVDLAATAVVVDAAAEALPAASLLLAVAARRGTAPSALAGGFAADPLGCLAAKGSLPRGLAAAYAEMCDLAVYTHEVAPQLESGVVSTLPYHEAGATTAAELGFALATGIDSLRQLTAAGLSVDAAVAQIGFAFGAGRDLFTTIAKLRAMRRLWARVVEACGGEAALAVRLHVRTSKLNRSRRDPWVNALRATTESFAAAIGGADSLVTAPFDEPLGLPTATSRRLALNTQNVLAEEAYLERVEDPAAGSYFLESLTETLAGEAWEVLQDVERRGGMARALVDGEVSERIHAAASERRRRVARRIDAIVGVSEFPDLAEERLERDSRPPAPEPAAGTHVDLVALRQAVAGDVPGRCSVAAVAAADAGASLVGLAAALGRGAEPTRCPVLPALRLAAPFEELRDAADRWSDAQGQRPRAFLVQLGGEAIARARVAFVANFLAAGGIEAVEPGNVTEEAAVVAAYAESGAALAVLCASDELYREWVPRLAPRLREQGARVVLAGKGGAEAEAYRQAGVEDFLYLGCDAEQLLATWLQQLGVVAG